MDDLAEHGFLGLRFDTRGAGSTRLGADAPPEELVRAALQSLARVKPK